jgi:hypothetical protein
MFVLEPGFLGNEIIIYKQDVNATCLYYAKYVPAQCDKVA